MAKKAVKKEKTVQAVGKPSSLVDTRVIYCGDNLDYSQDALSEIQAFFKKTGKSIIALTVKDVLDEQ
ncbi:MAG TPA: hypothetical protein VMW24_06780, partial [Sedimentisphaerales bacterium]|nr:hypothetical protein [Sedimentisphaerales bacterium]